MSTTPQFILAHSYFVNLGLRLPALVEREEELDTLGVLQWDPKVIAANHDIIDTRSLPSMNNRTSKHRLYQRYRIALNTGDVLSPEDQAWLGSIPIGREYGSPDDERLVALDTMKSFPKADGATAQTIAAWMTKGRN